jgi:hypothetical protein
VEGGIVTPDEIKAVAKKVLNSVPGGMEGSDIAEPDFDLVEPGGPRRREVETHVWMTFEPA